MGAATLEPPPPCSTTTAAAAGRGIDAQVAVVSVPVPVVGHQSLEDDDGQEGRKLDRQGLSLIHI